MVKMRERIEFIDRCLSWNWRLQQKSESWQANVNKEFKIKYLDVSRNRQRVLVEIQEPVILELQAVSLVLKFGEGRWLEQKKAEEDPGVSESGLALQRGERGRLYALGPIGLGAWEWGHYHDWGMDIEDNSMLDLTTLHGILCSILLEIFLQMILCEYKKRWLKWNSKLTPWEQKFFGLFFFSLGEYSVFVDLSKEAIMRIRILFHAGEESISLANLWTL